MLTNLTIVLLLLRKLLTLSQILTTNFVFGGDLNCDRNTVGPISRILVAKLGDIGATHCKFKSMITSYDDVISKFYTYFRKVTVITPVLIIFHITRL